MTQSGNVSFSKMDEVIFGKPAAEATANVCARLGANRVFLMVSNTLNRTTDEIEKLRRGLSATVTPAPSMQCRRTHRAKRSSLPANRPVRSTPISLSRWVAAR